MPAHTLALAVFFGIFTIMLTPPLAELWFSRWRHIPFGLAGPGAGALVAIWPYACILRRRDRVRTASPRL